MSLSLGEKLRQAREEKGLTLHEVSEKTRISPVYLQSIEDNDYRKLPGGIFNKGFIKSYAKLVGINENEALNDYSQIVAQSEIDQFEESKVYKPAVLTGNEARGSLSTFFLAAVILTVMTIGILYLVNYLGQNREVTETVQPQKPVANNQAPTSSNTSPESPVANTPDIASLNVEIQAIAPVTIVATVDSDPPKRTNVKAGEAVNFTPKESLTINFNRWNAQNLQLAINGRRIALPAEPLSPNDRDRIIFTISKENLAQIWTTGAISNTASPAVTEVSNSNATNTDSTNNTSVNVRPTMRTQPTPRVFPTQTPGPQPTATVNNPSNIAATPVPSPARKLLVVSNAPSNRP